MMKHAKGENEMSATQIRAAEILLNKTLPNLTATELKAEVSQATISDTPEMTKEEWQKDFTLGHLPPDHNTH